PWALAKDPNKQKDLASVMNHLANAIFIAGMLLKPVLVTASDKLFDQLGLSGELKKYENVYHFGFIGNVKVQKGEQLFPRLDNEVEVSAIQEMMKK
ncbi:MAG: methionine--tRNA ligase, partial [Candidatus Izemoplasmatales bacterium]|nr:methionine--tRNA ligase [Candidatus Izemoplasmatales bacterium]